MALRRQFATSLVLAQLAVWGASTASAADPMTFPVQAGDHLQVVVYGEQILSGRFRVEPDGSIYYPLVGKLEVAGLSPAEIGKVLGESLSETVRISLPMVSVAEYAPVFLVGDVMQTGPFQFRPDMLVFELVLLGGGVASANVPGSARLSVLQELSSLELSSFALRIQKARLLAGLEGGGLDLSALADQAAALNATSVVSAETAIFTARRRAKQFRERTHAAQIEGYDQEISSIEDSIVLHDQEISLLEEQLDVQVALAERGLAAHSSRRDSQRQLMGSRREALEFRTALFRAKQDRIAVGQALKEAEIRLEEEDLKALHGVELELEQNAIALRIAKAKYAHFDARPDDAKDIATLNVLGRVPTFRITRRVDGQYTSRFVDAFAKLERGDIVNVTFDSSGKEVGDKARAVAAGQ